jgi:transglutaminase-like putative cysteine protease
MLSEATRDEFVAYRLEQEYRYSYESTVRNVCQRLVVAPRKVHGGQRRRAFSLTIDGAVGVSSLTTDGFGNDVVTATIDKVDSVVAFRSSAEIDIRGVAHRLSVHPAALRNSRYRMPTRLTRTDRPLRQIASNLARTASGEALAALICSWTHGAIEYGYGPTSVRTPASEAARGGRGVCQDFAHIMIAICRSAGLPARYVSGHLVGEGGSHAWVEVLLADENGPSAVAFDPTHDRRTTQRYLTVAIGRDYADVAPTSGTFEGACSSMLTSTKRLFVREEQESDTAQDRPVSGAAARSLARSVGPMLERSKASG